MGRAVTRFTKPRANEWIRPVRRGYKLACCDCSLVHDMDFRVHKGHIEMRFRINARSTAAMRRHLGLHKWKNGTWHLRKEVR